MPHDAATSCGARLKYMIKHVALRNHLLRYHPAAAARLGKQVSRQIVESDSAALTLAVLLSHDFPSCAIVCSCKMYLEKNSQQQSKGDSQAQAAPVCDTVPLCRKMPCWESG